MSKGLAKPATVEELLEVLEETQKHGLVHLCDNVMNKPTYICSCCSCCCHMLKGIKEKQTFAMHSSNFIATIELENCINCGVCADKCPVDTITMSNQGNGKVVPVVYNELCIGCGLRASVCPTKFLDMSRRSVLHVPPKNIKEKMNRMAIENGRV